MRHYCVLVAGLCLSGWLAAQVPVNGPVEGFVFDGPTKSLRAVNGSLGSASLGPALMEGLEYGSAAAGHDHGIAFREGRCLVVTGLGSGHPAVTEPADIPCAVPEDVAWSADGSVAVLYSRTGNWIYTLKGLPGAARLGDALDVSLLGGSLSAAAIDGSGAHVAMGLVGETSGVFELMPGQGGVPLLAMTQPISLSFSEDGATLYALDRATNQLSALRMANFTSETWPLDGLADPIAVAAGRGPDREQVLYVAGGADRLLITYRAGSPADHQARASVALSAQPTAVERLGPTSFLLGSRVHAADPLWSFTNAREPRVFFIPATPLPQEEEIGQ